MILSKEEMEEAVEFIRHYIGVKACKDCKYSPRDLGSGWAKCLATDNYISSERNYTSSICGPAGRLFVKRSERTRGILEKFWIFLFGSN